MDKDTVINAAGYFQRAGNQIVFKGDVTVEDSDGRERTISGEHGQNDYDWNGFWTEPKMIFKP